MQVDGAPNANQSGVDAVTETVGDFEMALEATGLNNERYNLNVYAELRHMRHPPFCSNSHYELPKVFDIGEISDGAQ